MPRKWKHEIKILENGKRTKLLHQYSQWRDMLRRCEAGGRHQLKYPTYIGCTHYLEWKSYDVWMEWARNQVGFLGIDTKGGHYHLDKDILFKGNKHYSPETCVFVPPEVNMFLTNRAADRGEYPIGVYLKKSLAKYGSLVSRGDKARHLGYFATPELAFAAYKVAKEAYAKQLAIKYEGLVDPRVIDALNKYTVEITD